MMLTSNRQAFLDVIATSEGTIDIGQDGYDVLFGSTKRRPLLFTSFADHPRIRTYEKRDEFIRNGRRDYTTAAGRYMITASTYDGACKSIGVSGFFPPSQDEIAFWLMRCRKALDAVDAGDFDTAVLRCASIWASFPTAGYGQPENKLSDLRRVFVNCGGRLKDKNMPVY